MTREFQYDDKKFEFIEELAVDIKNYNNRPGRVEKF